MYVCTFMYVCMYVCAYMFVKLCNCTCVRIYIYIFLIYPRGSNSEHKPGAQNEHQPIAENKGLIWWYDTDKFL